MSVYNYVSVQIKSPAHLIDFDGSVLNHISTFARVLIDLFLAQLGNQRASWYRQQLDDFIDFRCAFDAVEQDNVWRWLFGEWSCIALRVYTTK